MRSFTHLNILVGCGLWMDIGILRRNICTPFYIYVYVLYTLYEDEVAYDAEHNEYLREFYR